MLKSPPIHQTPLYRAKAAYRNMKIRCGNANGKSPSYSNVHLKMSMNQWLEWYLPQYERLLQNPDFIPNAARFNDAGDYEIGNIEIISKSKNTADQIYTVDMVDLICPNCQRSFQKPKRYVKSKTRLGNKMFCSRQCSSQYNGLKRWSK